MKLLEETPRRDPAPNPNGCFSYYRCFLAATNGRPLEGFEPNALGHGLLKRIHPTRRASDNWRKESTNPSTNTAISSAAVSNAK